MYVRAKFCELVSINS